MCSMQAGILGFSILSKRGNMDAGAACVLDKSKFDVWLHLHALRVPKELSLQAAKILSKFVLDKPRIKHIVPDPGDPELRRIILSEGTSPVNLPEDKLLPLKKITGIDIIPHDVLLDYAYWPVEHILKDILPAGCEVPSAFECVGHIAHLNLRDELLPYRKVIAQVFLDKNQKIKTVVNKVGTITNEFRVPQFEVLAGKQSLVTEVKQHGTIFRMDYGLVYWNSRLEFEHKRLVNQFKPGQVVCDMFAGIGPFAIPAAQRGCTVYANDLNPASIKYLKVNAKLNKVESRVHAFCMDARQFIKHLVRSGEEAVILGSGSDENCSVKQEVQGDHADDEQSRAGVGPLGEAEVSMQASGSHLQSSYTAVDVAGSGLGGTDEHKLDPGRLKDATSGKGNNQPQVNVPCSTECKPWEHFDHVVMNLPASALDFLDTFNGLLSRTHWNGLLPRIHCYCFKRSAETVADIVKRAEMSLQGGLHDVSVWTVRDVAPNKVMLCLSFDLPKDFAFKNVAEGEVATESRLSGILKRPRID